MQKGEIWLAVWPNDPRKKPRPVLIVSNNFRNAKPHILDIVVCKLTSLERVDGSKKSINQAEDFVITLKKKSIIRCGSVFSLPKSFLQKSLGTLSSAEIAAVNERLVTVFGLHEVRPY